jgi:hypothetical protein
VIVVIANSFRQRGETEWFLSRFPHTRSWALLVPASDMEPRWGRIAERFETSLEEALPLRGKARSGLSRQPVGPLS